MFFDDEYYDYCEDDARAWEEEQVFRDHEGEDDSDDEEEEDYYLEDQHLDGIGEY